jgi:hypothetical protein
MRERERERERVHDKEKLPVMLRRTRNEKPLASTVTTTCGLKSITAVTVCRRRTYFREFSAEH